MPSKKVAPRRVTARSKSVIESDGLTFKDLNANGVLDPYEDWRLPTEERVSDLLGRMTVAEKVGILLITSHYMGASGIIGDPDQGLLNAHEKWSTENIWATDSSSTRFFDPPVLDYVGSEKAIRELCLRYFIIRDNPTSYDLATWVNALQELAESTRLGIPVVMVSNPRNHLSDTKIFGVAETADQMSQWPGELGLAATQDPDLVEEFGRLSAAQWRSAGITKGYMYMADIVTDPRWSRAEGTFGENTELAAQMVAAVTRGFQGPRLGEHSVSLTTKHFPGGGPRDRGHDPHFHHGRYQPYPTPGSLYRYHLPVFQAAIDAGTTSVMPYYATTTNARSAPQLHGDRPFAEVGFGYDRYLLTDVLRGELGFTGYVNSDTGITTGMPWGVESLTRPERFGLAIEAGINAFSGDGNPEPLLDAVAQGLVSDADLDRCARYLLTEMFDLGLFEDPYVDPDEAQARAEDMSIAALAAQAHRRSLVLLRNDKELLPLTADAGGDGRGTSGERDRVTTGTPAGHAPRLPAARTVRLYVEVFTGKDKDAENARIVGEVRDALGTDPTIEVVTTLDDATHVLLWVRPAMSLLDDRAGHELSIVLDQETGIDAYRVVEIENAVPTILAVNFTNPWLLDRVAPAADAVIGTFGTSTAAMIDLVRGLVTPTGKLPYAIPASEEAVRAKASDIPGAAEPEGYAYVDHAGGEYRFGYGLEDF
ncbi:glycoside hydrolase family 3 protein [Georgenia yuyongxinii]|uniref:beta-glucosidase n=1 Tax=Georgenia yuyongxinii TaxID=2589797 RepID=A0A5B8CA75_9MICO|nr:glycoside hydrolase family 3 N-terminal domain-containing protein [Georgenia yuyongxinii]QDC24976.1 glycoside hydrolase family 3 protein [Georgenia yuyongxinii]